MAIRGAIDIRIQEILSLTVFRKIFCGNEQLAASLHTEYTFKFRFFLAAVCLLVQFIDENIGRHVITGIGLIFSELFGGITSLSIS